MTRKYFTCAETAKFIRAALKEAFPAIKFSVRSDTYSGGASIRIGWTDGPNEAQVKGVVAPFEGGYFDGSIDYKGSVYAMLDGEPVHFGADFIFTNRHYSDEMVASRIRWAFNYFGGMDSMPTVEDYRQGRLWNLRTTGNVEFLRELNIALNKHTYCLTGRSKTAGRAFVTHDDGYSRSCGSGHSAVNPD